MIDVIILAAGKGTRMKSKLPKVLQTVAGVPLIEHVVNTALQIDSAKIHVVVGHQSELVCEVLQRYPVNQIVQEVQLGTGHAVTTALPHVQKYGISLILYGDVPLISLLTLKQMISMVDESGMSLLTTELEDPYGYGRIVRDKNERVTEIVEQKDASESQLTIQEVNTGILAVRNEDLEQWLPSLSNSNVQGEYYLTDIIQMAVASGKEIRTVEPQSVYEILGVNDRLQQAHLERVYQEHVAQHLMHNGVRLVDPTRVDVRGQIDHGTDVYIDVNCVFEGKIDIGNQVIIESHCVLKNCIIADGCHIKAFSHIEDAVINEGCEIGPYARLRPGTRLDRNVKVGNFVETKNCTIGDHSKVNHLSYLGDTDVGEQVNVGAGTITCNYDGANKHKTTIKDGAFIGSNSALVAPVKIGSNATVAAGSTICENVPDDSLALTRPPQITKKDWQRPKKK